MKKFISILIALFAILTIQAQQYSLDKTFINTCVVQQHIDVGVVYQTNFQNIYIEQPAQPRTYIAVSNTTFETPRTVYYYTSYTEQYRRGVGLITSNASYNTIQTTNLVRDVYTQNNYQNVQKYYCN